MKFMPEIRFKVDTSFEARAASTSCSPRLKSPATSTTSRGEQITWRGAQRLGRQRLAHPGQAARHDLDQGRDQGAGGSSRRPRPGMPARSIRSRPGCCRSRSAKRPRPCRSWSRARRPTASPCASAPRPIPTTPRAPIVAESAARPVDRGDRGDAAALHRRDQPSAAALLGAQGRRRPRLRPRPRQGGVRARTAHRLGRAAQPHRTARSPTIACSRRNAARAPMCARLPAISAGRSARAAMSRRCGGRGSARSARRRPSRSPSSRRRRRARPRATR